MRWRPFDTAYWLILLAIAASGSSVMAQAGPNIFVTPVPDAPFSAVVNVERSMIQADGNVKSFKTVRNIGQDSRGRIYNESRELVPVASTKTPELMTVLIYDPETRISAVLNPRERTFRATVVNRPPATVPPALLYASPTGESLPDSKFTKEEDLGTGDIGGLPAHGVRKIQTIPPESSGTRKENVIMDEYWYSNDLRINVMLRHVDPRLESVTMTVTNITQSEPDPALFEIPQDYTSAGRRQLRKAQ
jgi:hypothetical protein